jgi:hypothetical protein
MSGPYTLTAPGLEKIQSAATTGNGGILQLAGKSHMVTFVLQSNGTTSGGVVSIEEAYFDLNVGDPVYSGTWSLIQAVNASDFTGTAQKVIHVVASCPNVRARISSDITGGGSVTVWAWGN